MACDAVESTMQNHLRSGKISILHGAELAAQYHGIFCLGHSYKRQGNENILRQINSVWNSETRFEFDKLDLHLTNPDVNGSNIN